jgi:hypothetical protein
MVDRRLYTLPPEDYVGFTSTAIGEVGVVRDLGTLKGARVYVDPASHCVLARPSWKISVLRRY